MIVEEHMPNKSIWKLFLQVSPTNDYLQYVANNSKQAKIKRANTPWTPKRTSYTEEYVLSKAI